jgi:hypothetical protein
MRSRILALAIAGAAGHLITARVFNRPTMET